MGRVLVFKYIYDCSRIRFSSILDGNIKKIFTFCRNHKILFIFVCSNQSVLSLLLDINKTFSFQTFLTTTKNHMCKTVTNSFHGAASWWLFASLPQIILNSSGKLIKICKYFLYHDNAWTFILIYRKIQKYNLRCLMNNN